MGDGLRIIQGDITRLAGMAVVRCVATGDRSDPATDPLLLAGGDALWTDIQRHEPLIEARPVVTPPYRLPATAVIHVAAPVWQGGHYDKDRRLALVVERVLVAAVRHRLPRVAFSPIGPGFPLDHAAAIAIGTIHSALFAAPDVEEIVIVCPTTASWRIYDSALLTLLD